MRDDSISMTKGIAIILMVLVHARFNQYGQDFINMFHMPLFFVMSGFCFKETYLSNFRRYLKNRLRGAYWPYVKWGLLFLLLHNVFFSLNIYNDEYGFRGEVSHVYSMFDFLWRGVLIVASMNEAEHMIGGYWFLHCYFVAAIISFATIWLFRNRQNLLPIGGGILLLTSIVSSYYDIEIPFYVRPRDLLASFFMVVGFLYKKYGFKFEEKPLFAIPVGIIMVVLGVAYWKCAMTSLEWWKIFPYSLSALAGTLMVFSICKWLCEKHILAKSLVYIGDRTIDILTWHFLSFKLVSLLIIAVYLLPEARLAEFPVIEEYSYQGWWMPYLLVGVSLPLLTEYILRRSYIMLLKK